MATKKKPKEHEKLKNVVEAIRWGITSLRYIKETGRSGGPGYPAVGSLNAVNSYLNNPAVQREIDALGEQYHIPMEIAGQAGTSYSDIARRLIQDGIMRLKFRGGEFKGRPLTERMIESPLGQPSSGDYEDNSLAKILPDFNYEFLLIGAKKEFVRATGGQNHKQKADTSRTNGRKLSPPLLPRQPDARDLLRKVQAGRKTGRGPTEIAREFFNGDNTKMERHMRTVRRYEDDLANYQASQGADR